MNHASTKPILCASCEGDAEHERPRSGIQGGRDSFDRQAKVEKDAKNTSRKWGVRRCSPPNRHLFVRSSYFALSSSFYRLLTVCLGALTLQQDGGPSERGTSSPVIRDFAEGTWRKLPFSLPRAFGSAWTVPVLLRRALHRELSEPWETSPSPHQTGWFRGHFCRVPGVWLWTVRNLSVLHFSQVQNKGASNAYLLDV